MHYPNRVTGYNNMRNENSCIHFLKTGELGPLSFSLSLEEVCQVLGPPEKTWTVTIFVYGKGKG